jgi:hypothetical protein
VLARIAAVQLDYLPAYFDSKNECLASPLEASVKRLGDTGANNVLNQWRQTLKNTYEKIYGSKLKQIVRFCASLKVDVVIFPEYSIPVECLLMMKSLSERLRISIVAGTHRVEISNGPAQELYRSLSGNDGPKIQVSMQDHAICPIFIQGRFDYIQKLTSSQYDLGVGVRENEDVKWGLISFPCQKGHLNVCIYVCSDYLPSNRDRVNALTKVDRARGFQATIVVSSTPSLGPFANQALESNNDANDAQRRAHGERNSNPVIFVNNAWRGGTKIFYDLRPRPSGPEYLLLEDSDGSFGRCEIEGPVVTRCGLEGNAEGIVVVETDNSKGGALDTRLVAVCPIVHCEGPEDPLVLKWKFLFNEYRGQGSLQDKKSFLSREDTRLASLIQLGKNPIFTEKVQILRDNIENCSNERVLDSMVCDFCIVSDEVPHKDSWIYRSSLASTVKLKEIRDMFTNVKRDKLEDLLKHCEKRLKEVSTSPNLPSHEKDFREELIDLPPEDLLVTSGIFYTLITRERSSVKTSVNAARWIRHLLETHLLELETGVIEDVLQVIKHIKEVRPYPAVSVLNELQSLLEKSEENYIKHAIDYLRNFKRDCAEAKRRLSSHANLNFKLQKGETILIFGYSEAVMLLLRPIASATPDHLPK